MDLQGRQRECVPDATTWRAEIGEGDNACGLHRLEDGCCVVQYDRDLHLLQMYKHFIQHPHKPISPAFEQWVRNLDGLQDVGKAVISMSHPDFEELPKLVKQLESCGTVIEVMVDHTVEGNFVPSSLQIFISARQDTLEILYVQICLSLSVKLQWMCNILLER